MLTSYPGRLLPLRMMKVLVIAIATAPAVKKPCQHVFKYTPKETNLNAYSIYCIFCGTISSRNAGHEFL